MQTAFETVTLPKSKQDCRRMHLLRKEMMSEPGPEWQDWINKLADGDEQVVHEFWHQYGPRLQQLADRHLAVGMKRRIDADDVVQSACRTFLRRVQGTEFALADSESLWRLMCAITLTKLRWHVRFHKRQKRAIDQERHFESTAGEGSDAARRASTNQPLPDEAVAFSEQFEALLNDMDDDEQKVIQLKLAEYTHEEIAEQLSCSERTVRRIVKRIQARLKQTLEHSIS